MSIKFILRIFIILNFLPISLFSYTNNKINFNIGEKFIYDITVFNIKVAQQKTYIKDIVTLSNREHYYIYTTIKTVPVISKIYKLNDIIETYIDKETLLPFIIRTKISEKNWKNRIFIRIDNKKKKVFYHDRFGKKYFKFRKHFFGLISLLYYARSIKAKHNERIDFNVHNKRKKNKIKTKWKYSKNKKFIPALKKKKKFIKLESVDDKNAELWLTNDKHRIPFKFISIKIPVVDYGFISIINTLKYYNKGKKLKN